MIKEKEAAPSLADLEVCSTPETEPAGDLLELILTAHEARALEEAAAPSRIDGVLVGRLAALGAEGEALVEFQGSAGRVGARAMVALGAADKGREVALMFEGGDPARPVIMGFMHVPHPVLAAATADAPRAKLPEAEADGERLELTAEKEIVLRCGDASITLTRAGKILIRGEYV